VFLCPAKTSNKSKKEEKIERKRGEDAKPIDLLVDDLIGYLERSSAFMRVVANRVFAAVCGEVEESTMHLLLTVSTWSYSLPLCHSQYFSAATRETGCNCWRGTRRCGDG
jgi:hypothetical protein